MSATNRGAERNASVFYPTPIETTLTLASWLDRKGVPTQSVLDPSAGDGAILRAFQHPARRLLAFELREECREQLSFCDEVQIGDALAGPKRSNIARLVAANPPFSLAREFIERFRYAGDTSAFLLRINFLASQSRAPWWVADPPAHVLVLPKRPSFSGNGKTDATDYAWFVWQGRTEPGDTRLDWLVSP